MKLSTKGRYAVMAMVDLAESSKDRPVALADIADRQEISLSYLEQLFGKLRKGGLVRSVRGPGGGYLLARTAQETRVADVILAVDEPIRAPAVSPGRQKDARPIRDAAKPMNCGKNLAIRFTFIWRPLAWPMWLDAMSVVPCGFSRRKPRK